MEMQISDLAGDLKKVTFNGRLDTPGVLGIETQFVTGLVPAAKSTIVDLSQVEFLGSMGIRMFISVARILRDKQAKLALYAPQRMVNEVLESASVGEILPVCGDASEATAAVRN